MIDWGALAPIGLTLAALVMSRSRNGAGGTAPAPAAGGGAGGAGLPANYTDLPYPIATPEPSLRVAMLQLALRDAGLNPGPLNARWGPGTWSAMNARLNQLGLPNSSVLGEEQWLDILWQYSEARGDHNAELLREQAIPIVRRALAEPAALEDARGVRVARAVRTRPRGHFAAFGRRY
jgi:hypothetical protein